MKIIYHHATSGGSQKSSENTKPIAVYKQIEQENERELKESFRKILKNGPELCLDYLLLAMTKITIT